jgi:hypothetical protein
MNDAWWRTLSRIMWWVATRVFAPFMALGMPVLAIYGVLDPRPGDADALRLRGHEMAALIGVAEGDGCTTAGCSLGERSFIVLPRVFSTGSVVSVRATVDGSVATEVSGGAPIVVLMWAACAFATWRVVLRPIAYHHRTERTSDG